MYNQVSTNGCFRRKENQYFALPLKLRQHFHCYTTAKNSWKSAFVLLEMERMIIVHSSRGGFDSFSSITAFSVVNPLFNRLTSSVYSVSGGLQLRSLLQKRYRYEVYCRKHHTKEALFSAFCGGDKTICIGRNLFSLRFWIPSRRNQDFWRPEENS